MILQRTTPLRKASDIDDALEMMYNKNASAVVSVSKSNKPMYWHYTIKKTGYSNLFFH
jgi:CMP-N-acetylneuraminic acid synthetase